MENKVRAPHFVNFMVSEWGRGTRIGAGLLMMGFGFSSRSQIGTIVGVIGILPFVAGAFDICVLGPIFGGYLSGRETRRVLDSDRRAFRIAA